MALDFAIKLAKKAGETLLSYYQTGGIQSFLKEDHTVITQADLATDHLIRTSIQSTYPKDGILSEEGNTIYPGEKRFVWIIDPLDGTTNFSLGLHYWGVVITRLQYGIPHLAVLFFPLLNELFTAVKGAGAYLNGEKLQINPKSLSRTETFFSCCSRTHQRYRVDLPYKTRILGSAAYGLSSIARGSSILAFEVTPKVWDFSGSWLITQEAQGYIAALEGNSIFPLQPGVDYKSRNYPMLAAPTQERWEHGKKQIQLR